MAAPSANLVSIALCTYNGEKYLAAQLESILGQDYSFLEVIIVDDRSTDATRSILETYIEKDPRIKFYANKKNIGYTKNFEKAIRLCSGDYIALSDQDDVWQRNKISLMMASVSGHIIVYHNSDFIDAGGERIGTDTMASRYRMYRGESCLPFILSNSISGHAVLFDREIINYMLPFDQRFYHDWWLAYVAFNIGRVKYIDQVLVHYRQHPRSITDSLNLRQNDLQKAAPARGIERISLNLDWLQYCAAYSHNRQPALIKTAYDLLSNLARGRKRFSAFLFLVKYFDLLFYICYPPKSMISKANMARKICFR